MEIGAEMPDPAAPHPLDFIRALRKPLDKMTDRTEKPGVMRQRFSPT